MANSITHGATPPIKGARYTVPVLYVDADGDPTDPTTPDTEVSIDGGAFADAAEEVTTIAGSNGCGYITLTGAEMDATLVALAFKVSSGPKAPLRAISPLVLASVGTGTLSAGSAGGGTLGTLLTYDVTGCFIKTTAGTGGGGTGGANNQVRKIVTYNTSTGAFTVSPNWETTPDATTTYDVLLPDGISLAMLRNESNVVKISGDATAADNWEAACDGTGYNVGGGLVMARNGNPGKLHYVDPDTGNDANAGTYDAPLDTTAQANTNASPLDTIVLLPGTYPDLARTFNKPSITIIGAGWAGTVLSTTDTTYALRVDADNVTVRGFAVAASDPDAIGLDLNGHANITVDNMSIEGNFDGLGGENCVGLRVTGGTHVLGHFDGAQLGGATFVIEDRSIIETDGSLGLPNHSAINIGGSARGIIRDSSLIANSTTDDDSNLFGINGAVDWLLLENVDIAVESEHADSDGNVSGIELDANSFAIVRGGKIETATAGDGTEKDLEIATGGLVFIQGAFSDPDKWDAGATDIDRNWAAGGDLNVELAAKTETADFLDDTAALDAIGTEVQTQIVAFGPLRPTTAGRTLDVTAGGEAGIDLNNVGSPTTTLNLSGLTIKNVSDVDTQCDTIISTTAATDTKAQAIQGVTDKLETMLENSGGQERYIAAALATSPTGVGGFTEDDRTDLGAIAAKLPSKTYLTGTANSDGDIQINEATGTAAGAFPLSGDELGFFETFFSANTNDKTIDSLTTPKVLNIPGGAS